MSLIDIIINVVKGKDDWMIQREGAKGGIFHLDIIKGGGRAETRGRTAQDLY